ncbi:phosphoribosyltransferase [Pelagibacterium xiamenense]|uniref:phosphoribosyltransferase n=1 Tax=Pelagibacterium xiamenense TaxID=2901140 RepID=UPI001E480C91|nr:phosphoribosyltransferase [Pelagibacterium xiamenense]MCD7059803.1 phosphoribosyltransferase [Pelagibacterium xiamenense]
MRTHLALFLDRTDAGKQLATALSAAPRPDIVFALPRGGVPVGYEIATAFNLPLELLMVRKIPAPGHGEYGIGAVVDGATPQIVLNDNAMSVAGVTQAYIDAQVAKKLKEIEQRRRRYAGERSPLPAAGKSVILVDDGIATGGTALAGLRALRAAGARWITLAVPVAPPEGANRMEADADAVVCLHRPTKFRAVGEYYEQFDQISDDIVTALMKSAAERV